MRRFCSSFLLVHGGSGNRPCSSDEIKIQHRGTPSTPFFWSFVLCATLLCPSGYGQQLLQAHHSQLMDSTKVFARRVHKLKVERQGQLLLSCQLKNP
uniref:Putative secreted protein n=1 Tax=Ixodes ricinus TaxID=34613 RepID=A0A6B0U4M3_IXORI